MAEPIHEVSKMKIDKAIDAELDRIAHEIPVLRPLREKIVLAGHSSVKKTKRSRAPEFGRSRMGKHISLLEGADIAVYRRGCLQSR